ncbi:hypothetical protein [Kiloniella sp. b19]|uniref:hypothetical protein n=1 Tax=Kiloniella sp. GXU_MW_B19 TaxID=3141326 RepID=UPI0031DEE15A
MDTNDDLITLELADLLPDEAGEVVLFASDDPVSIQSDSPVVNSGVVEHDHITMTGENVSGLTFSHFANGITVYHDSSDIQIVAPLVAEM